jgi:hypothetical protein
MLIDWSYTVYLLDYISIILSQIQWKFAESIFALIQLIMILGPTSDINCDIGGSAVWQIWCGKFQIHDKRDYILSLHIALSPKGYINTTVLPKAYEKMRDEIRRLCAPATYKTHNWLFNAIEWTDLVSRVALATRIMNGELINSAEPKWSYAKELEYLKKCSAGQR